MIRRVPLKRARIRPSASPVQSTRGAAGAAVSDRTRRQPGPEAKRTAAKRRASEREKARVYILVDQREGYACRLTRRTHDLEHHHILPRSRGGKHTSGNVVLLHRDVHRDVTENRLAITGDANGELLFTWKDGREVRCAVGVTAFYGDDAA